MVREIPLSQGKVALVDDSDYERVGLYHWSAVRRVRRYAPDYFYAVRHVTVNGRQTTVSLHRFLLPDIPQIDHVDGDALNNQRSNLRAATRSQNVSNRRRSGFGRSKFLGVNERRDTGRWRAQICVRYRNINIGTFGTEEEAARAYDQHALLHFGEFATLNFPQGARS